MADNLGEELFERYARISGYSIIDHHPSMGTAKRPDYLVSCDNQFAVIEVESFNTAPLSADHPRSGFVDARPKMKAIRDKISAGAKQLKGIKKFPLVVVLANPYNSWVPLDAGMFLGALYGDPSFTFSADGTAKFFLGRNGRLHVTEPDGSEHGNHPYLSAVAVLRSIYTNEAWAEAMNQARAAGFLEPLSGVREMTRIVMSMGEQAVAGICLDVYETVSPSAVPLPRNFFSEPNDTRWGAVAPGMYGQIAGPHG